jgi:hypothetical protein
MTIITEIQHSSHRHRLKLMWAQTPYWCNGCKEEGFEPCYQCQECDFHLHEQCASAERGSIFPHPFEKSTFKFYGKHTENGMNFGFCVACGKNIRGFMYQSLCKKAFRIHPCCLKLERETTDHGHGVTLKLREKISWPSKACLKCQSREISKEIKGWAYVSTCGNCCYHVACVKALTLEKWRASSFHQQTDGKIAVNLELGLGEITGTNPSESSERWLSKIKVALRLIITAILGKGIPLILLPLLV